MGAASIGCMSIQVFGLPVSRGVAIGRAVLGTVAWTTVANSVRAQVPTPGAPVPASAPAPKLFNQLKRLFWQ